MAANVVVEAAEAEELPKAIVRRVVKEKLSELSKDGGDVILHKEALIAFSESARVFIHYLSATANDICKDTRRQTINADDVLKGLDEIEFSEFIGPLTAALNEFRKKNAGKRAASAKAKESSQKKRKTDKESGADEADEQGVDENNNEEDDNEGDQDGDNPQGD